MKVKLINIGKSRGIRLPERIIKKYHFHTLLYLEEKKEGVLIMPKIPSGRMVGEQPCSESTFEHDYLSGLGILS